jgi:hypothetical protein
MPDLSPRWPADYLDLVEVRFRAERGPLELFDAMATVDGLSRAEALRDAMTWWTARAHVREHRRQYAEHMAGWRETQRRWRQVADSYRDRALAELRAAELRERRSLEGAQRRSP